MTEPAFLLDTNICIYLLGGAADAARTRVESCEEGALATSAITFAEVMIGIKDEAKRARAVELFAMAPVLPFDRSAAGIYADLPFRRGSYDRLIAAHALALGLILVTNNECDFADVRGLSVENWTRP